MSMEKPLMDIDQPGMQLTVNSYKPGSGMAWPVLFPLKFTPKFDLKGLEGNEGLPVAADRVAFNTKAPLKTRRTVGSWNGKLSKFAVSYGKDEMEINEYNDLKTIAANNTEDKETARYLVDMVYDDMDLCNGAMDAKVEIDAMGIGSSGKQVFKKEIDGDMATEDVIDFKVPAENFKGVAAKWNDAEKADGLKDIADAQDAIAKKGGKKPMFAIMEKAKFNELCAQKATARKLFPRADQGLISADMISLEAVNSYMNGKKYPQILVIDTYAAIQHKDGSESTIKPWNENVVALSPTQNLGYTYFKPVPMLQNTDALQVQGKFYKLTRYSDLNPMSETTMAEAYVQPGLTNRKSLVFLNTNSTSLYYS